MAATLRLAVLLFLFAQAVFPATPKATLADYLRTRRIAGASFSADEKLIAFVWDEGGRPDLWVKPVAGGAPLQVTHVQGVIHSYAFSPVEDALLYEVDQGGDDAPRLYLTDSKGRAPEELMPHFPKGARIGFVRWAKDGRSILFITNLPGEDFVTLQELNLATRDITRLWKSSGQVSLSLVTPDLQRFILQEVLSDVNFNLYMVERGHAEPVLLTPHEGDAAYTPTGFSVDGKKLYYTSTEGSEFAALYEVELATRKSRLLLRQQWDVEAADSSPGGRYLHTVTNVDGTESVTVKDLKTRRTLSLPKPAGGGVFVPVAYSKLDRYMAATRVTDTAPSSLYVIDLQTGKAAEVASIFTESQFGPMTGGEAIRIASFDGLPVPALLYKPAGPGPFPAVIEVHGGPVAQARRTYSGIRQYLVSKGCIVLVPNVRGSTGYGKRYTTLDDLDLGGGPLKDVIAAKQWLIANGKADPARIAIMGASYGGYMALAAAAFAPREFAAHVDFFGISDFKSLLASYPPYWGAYSTFTYKKYGDPKNPDHAKYQFNRSPLNFTDRIERPLLIVQGGNDRRVPKQQSESMVEKLKQRKAPVEYLLIPEEGHGFSNNDNRLKAYEAMDRFLDRYLFAKPTVAHSSGGHE
jgi:dipeptidyl aminopeptidase/acylaminoacyl peptidase